MAINRIPVALGTALVLLFAALGGWMLLQPNEAIADPPLVTAAAASLTVDDEGIADTLLSATPMQGASPLMSYAAVAPREFIPAEPEPVTGVTLGGQKFSRGGLGSKALMSFTVRNGNDFAIRDLEVACAFRSHDGSFSTERRRVIHGTVATKERKAFPPTHVGFVDPRATEGKCRMVTASRD